MEFSHANIISCSTLALSCRAQRLVHAPHTHRMEEGMRVYENPASELLDMAVWPFTLITLNALHLDLNSFYLKTNFVKALFV